MNRRATPGLIWRVETACRNGWPPLDRISLGDWEAGFGAGLTRRINSANPSGPLASLGDPDIAACAQAYAGWGLPAIFRVPSFLDPSVDGRLEDHGWSPEGVTLTLHAPMDDIAAVADAEVECQAGPTDEWLAARVEFAALAGDQGQTYARVARSLATPAVFAALRIDGRIASIGYGAVSERLVCLESIATDPALRGRGLARRLLGALLGSAQARGCEGACLQVEADNDPAAALYRSIGLRTELYRYHYRRAPQA